jgi:hypothetical protein
MVLLVRQTGREKEAKNELKKKDKGMYATQKGRHA